METKTLGTALLHVHHAEKSVGSVVLAHAMYQDSTYLTRPTGHSLVEFLNDAGFDVYRLDLSGYHGDALDPKISFHTYVDDVLGAIEEARSTKTGPVFVLGHSVSGLAAQVAGNLADVDGIISVAPAVWTFTSPASATANTLQAAKFMIGYSLAEAMGKFPAPLLRMGNRAAPLGYMREYRHWIATRKFESLDGRVNYQKTLAEGDVPTLLLSGPKDKALAPKENIRWLADCGHIPKEDQLHVSRKEGFSFDADHFSLIYGRKAAREVWPKLLSWLESKQEKPKVAAGSEL